MYISVFAVVTVLNSVQLKKRRKKQNKIKTDNVSNGENCCNMDENRCPSDQTKPKPNQITATTALTGASSR
jgi:hypothetical protein